MAGLVACGSGLQNLSAVCNCSYKHWTMLALYFESRFIGVEMYQMTFSYFACSHLKSLTLECVVWAVASWSFPCDCLHAASNLAAALGAGCSVLADTSVIEGCAPGRSWPLLLNFSSSLVSCLCRWWQTVLHKWMGIWSQLRFVLSLCLYLSAKVCLVNRTTEMLLLSLHGGVKLPQCEGIYACD